MVLPGPTLPFNGGGLDFDWYQPLYENGNILSYPLPSTGAFTPSDLGAYKVPCPAENDPACVLCDINTDAACADRQRHNAHQADRGTARPRRPNLLRRHEWLALRLQGHDRLGRHLRLLAHTRRERRRQGRRQGESRRGLYRQGARLGGRRVAQQQQLEWDADERTGDNERHRHHPQPLVRRLDARLRLLPGLLHRAGRHDQSHARGGCARKQHREEFLGGPLRREVRPGSTSRRASRPFTARPTCSSAGHPTTSSRKKLRGFFLRNSTLNPVSDTYDLLSSTPLAGDKVRVEANVYNYSTAVEINNLKVLSTSSTTTRTPTETKFTSCPGGATLQPQTGRCTVGETFVAQLDPLQTAPAAVTWDTTGFGPAGAGQSSDYRVYVVLDPENAIDETYETEDPNTDYKCVDGNGNPARCRRALTRGRTTKVSATPP